MNIEVSRAHEVMPFGSVAILAPAGTIVTGLNASDPVLVPGALLFFEGAEPVACVDD